MNQDMRAVTRLAGLPYVRLKSMFPTLILKHFATCKTTIFKTMFTHASKSARRRSATKATRKNVTERLLNGFKKVKTN